jgi:glucosamine--fructose-6-phosphate aminotransferase (isomerizing)
MCGIIATLSTNNIEILIEGLKQLQNRGYDSAGICSINDKTKKFINTKYASNNISAIEKLETNKNEHLNNLTGIAHTRWATHGPKTDINSHPHISYLENFALVHNGIIENYLTLKNELIEKNIDFKSETDSEVIVNLIEYYYQEVNDVEAAIKETLSRLEGTWGLAIITPLEPNSIFCTRKGSPILVSKNNNEAIIASEQSAFCNRSNNYICLNNHDLCKLYYQDNKICLLTSEKYNELAVFNTNIDLSPSPYSHWTEKEINEQIDSSLRAISLGGRLLSNNEVKLGGIEPFKNNLKDISNIIILGCGTSFFAGECGKNYFKDLCNFNTIQVIDGAEFCLNDIPKLGKTGIILLSQSGETKDLHRCIELVKDFDVITIGIINTVDSLIAREVNCGIYLNAGREVGVASTKSFTSQVIILSMLAIWFAQVNNINLSKRQKYITDLRNLSLNIETTLNTYNEKLEHLFKNKKSCFILGKGMGHYIAKEGCLKLKELSYIHAEGYSSSSLKHGPFALLEKDFPIILLAPKDSYFSKNMNAYEEVKTRHASVLLITNNNSYIANPNTLLLPNNDTYFYLLALIPIQMLAYKLAINNGNNPDMPRNLAKVVTVE